MSVLSDTLTALRETLGAVDPEYHAGIRFDNLCETRIPITDLGDLAEILSAEDEDSLADATVFEIFIVAVAALKFDSNEPIVLTPEALGDLIRRVISNAPAHTLAVQKEDQ